ncbi:MAG TPA: complex I NDUFA9 subunit family protein [Erythrobacter sp.]|nr:complex I NDUFA9 subunit family protein [Erythrobacter sp.]
MAQTNPLANKLVTLFGGSGFLGHYVAQALLGRGTRLRIASRNPERSFKLKPLANLGQLQFQRCDITSEQSLAAALAGSDAAINLVGAFDGDLMQLMGEAPRTMARLAQANGLQAFVHVSAIGSDAASPVPYARAKATGEQQVLAEFPQATIIKPSIIFGEDDNFLNLFAGLIQLMPVLPVFGPEAKLQLTYVGDVAEAIVTALEDPARHGGKTFELGGPEALTMMEINRRIAAAQGRQRHFIAVPDPASAVFAALPGSPMSRDQWALLKPGNTVSGEHPGYHQLGTDPRPLGLFLDKWMVRYRKHGRFDVTAGTSAT